jgi:hypothetical protein
MVGIGLVDCFGFHTEASWQHTTLTNTRRKQWNTAIWLGYIPLVSVIAGVGRIYHIQKQMGTKSSTMSVAAQVASVVRGILEMCCVGSLYALIDVLVYLRRTKNPVPTIEDSSWLHEKIQ